MSGHDTILNELMLKNATDAMDGIESRGDLGHADVPVDALEAKTRDYRAIVDALDTIYTSGSNVAALVESGKLDRGVIAREPMERWLVITSIERVGAAAVTLAGLGHELPEELKLDELVRAGALVAIPADDISWDEVEEVVFSVLPGVCAYAKSLYWDRWQEILGEGAPRLPFA